MAAFVESTTTQFLVTLISILGFLLTVINWINIDLVRKEFKRQNEEFIKTKGQIANKLTALRSQIIQCEMQQKPVDIYIKSELREELHLSLRNFKHLFKIKDKIKVNRIFRLSRNGINSEHYNMICNDLDYLIAFFRQSKEEE